MSKRRHLICMWIVMMLVISFISTDSFTIQAANTTSKETYINSSEELVQEVYKNLLAKKKSFSVSYAGDWSKCYENDLDALFQKAYAMDDKNTSDDYDYLKANVERYSLTLSSNGIKSVFKFTVSYRETAKQTKKVNTLVTKALKSLKLSNASNYKKVKKIHDYIVNKLTYDTSYSNYTAYKALTEKKAVCQGYALLFYKMATEAGVPCRIVVSDTHAWNIVKMGNKWYHVDTTWDDPISSKPILRYDYFLKGTKSMESAHNLLAEYTTKTFKKNFPISTSDYKR